MNLAMPRNWKIRKYRPGDEEGIFELWSVSHPERHYQRGEWLKFWDWEYKEIPDGSDIWLADDNGKIVGLKCITFRKMKFGDEIIRGVHGLDTLTHPDYRRQGIMMALFKTAYDELVQRGTYFDYGFPNEMAYPNHIKMGSLDVDLRKKMIRIINWENVLKRWISNKFLLRLGVISANTLYKIICRAPKAPVVKDLVITQVPRFDERIDEFWNKVAGKLKIAVVKSEEYLNWKYAGVPGHNYLIFIAEKGKTIYGYLVMSYQKEESKALAIIFDFLAEPEEIGQCLLQTAIERCRKDDIDYIYWAGVAPKDYLRTFRKRGFISQPSPKIGRLIVYSNTPGISMEFLTNPKNWLSQLGDSDVM